MEVLKDYSIRGRDLEGMNLLDFILNTREGSRPRRKDCNIVFVNYLPVLPKRTKDGSYEIAVMRLFPKVRRVATSFGRL
jgi:hypothetical protein